MPDQIPPFQNYCIFTLTPLLLAVYQCVKDVILPAAIYQQIIFRIYFPYKSQALQQVCRSFVIRHVISHDAVQLNLIERKTDCVGNNLLHISLSLIAFCDGVTHMASLEHTSNDIADRTTANDMGFFFVDANEMCRQAIFKFYLALVQPPFPRFDRMMSAGYDRAPLLQMCFIYCEIVGKYCLVAGLRSNNFHKYGIAIHRQTLSFADYSVMRVF